MSELAELRARLSELERQRGEVLEVRAAIRREAAAMREGGQARYGAGIADLAMASGESADALQRINRELGETRQAIIAARQNRGDKPDCPKGVISAWWPFLGAYAEGERDGQE